jgi:hypothetical protein
MLKQFWAVTLNSVYRVEAPRDGEASVTKVAHRGTLTDEDWPLGKDLSEGRMLAICRWLQTYYPGDASFVREIEKVNTRQWGRRSTPIVALFMSDGGAMLCHETEQVKECDSRWLDETKLVLEVIGDDHPSFYIPKKVPGLTLIERAAA